jgi:hypothetical protein
MNEKHYIVGAGMVGCLFDWGPEPCETMESALELARWYLETFDDVLPSGEQIDAMLDRLAHEGIYYFTEEERALVGADYIEISEMNGPCPESED